MTYYTVTEASKKLGISRPKIIRMVRSGKVKSVKGKHPKSPYKIHEEELPKIKEIEKAPKKNQKTTAPTPPKKTTTTEKKESPPQQQPSQTKEEKQNQVLETIRNLAVTQEKIASALVEVVKKM